MVAAAALVLIMVMSQTPFGFGGGLDLKEVYGKSDSRYQGLKRLSALGAGWIPAFNIASSTGICKLISAGEPFYTYHHTKYKEILPGKLLLSS